ncbi:MAG: rhodanese-like domain-containing protein [Bacteroidales bacterium]|nr:rhodanese-like domain-containing protein [Candidatus Scybalocola fimicaballi]
MRKLGNYFVMLTVAIMALFCTSCGSDDDEEKLGAFIEYTNPQSFYDTYNAYSGDKVLIDYRSADKYSAGHLSGAVNMPADVYNTQSDDAQWCKDLLATYPTSTCLFFYGTGSFEMNKTVAGRASRIGYGKEHSRIYSKSYDDLKSIWK